MKTGNGKTFSWLWGVAAICAVALLGGCSAVGLHMPRAVEVIENESVSIPPGTYLSDYICRAAGTRKWSPTVMSDSCVRCRYVARSWDLTVDVVHNNHDTFSIVYVSSKGLFYDPRKQTAHGTYNKMIRALCQQIRQETIITARVVPAPSYVPNAASVVVAQAEPEYTIVMFEREGGDEIAYRFELELKNKDSVGFDTSTKIQDEIRNVVRKESQASTLTGSSSVPISFPEYRMADGKVEGRAVVLNVELIDFVYNDETRHGRLSVRVNPRQYEMTRKWVHDNISTLANDKVGSRGSSRFRIGNEMMHDNNILEVEFLADR